MAAVAGKHVVMCERLGPVQVRRSKYPLLLPFSKTYSVTNYGSCRRKACRKLALGVRQLTYLGAGKARADFVDLFADLIEVDELEADGGDGTSGLQAPVAVKGPQGQRAVKVQCVLLQLGHHVEVFSSTAIGVGAGHPGQFLKFLCQHKNESCAHASAGSYHKHAHTHTRTHSQIVLLSTMVSEEDITWESCPCKITF